MKKVKKSMPKDHRVHLMLKPAEFELIQQATELWEAKSSIAGCSATITLSHFLRTAAQKLAEEMTGRRIAPR